MGTLAVAVVVVVVVVVFVVFVLVACRLAPLAPLGLEVGRLIPLKLSCWLPEWLLLLPPAPLVDFSRLLPLVAVELELKLDELFLSKTGGLFVADAGVGVFILFIIIGVLTRRAEVG